MAKKRKVNVFRKSPIVRKKGESPKPCKTRGCRAEAKFRIMMKRLDSEKWENYPPGDFCSQCTKIQVGLNKYTFID